MGQLKNQQLGDEFSKSLIEAKREFDNWLFANKEERIKIGNPFINMLVKNFKKLPKVKKI